MGAQRRMRAALRLAYDVGNVSFVLRALRLHGQLLIDAGSLTEGLRMLALVVSWADRNDDFTSWILDRRIWDERTAGVPPEQVQQAVAWATDRHPDDLVSSVLAASNPK